MQAYQRLRAGLCDRKRFLVDLYKHIPKEKLLGVLKAHQVSDGKSQDQFAPNNMRKAFALEREKSETSEPLHDVPADLTPTQSEAHIQVSPALVHQPAITGPSAAHLEALFPTPIQDLAISAMHLAKLQQHATNSIVNDAHQLAGEKAAENPNTKKTARWHAYHTIFMPETKALLRERFPEERSGDINTRAMNMWKNLSKDEQARYIARAHAEQFPNDSMNSQFTTKPKMKKLSSVNSTKNARAKISPAKAKMNSTDVKLVENNHVNVASQPNTDRLANETYCTSQQEFTIGPQQDSQLNSVHTVQTELNDVVAAAGLDVGQEQALLFNDTRAIHEVPDSSKLESWKTAALPLLKQRIIESKHATSMTGVTKIGTGVLEMLLEAMQHRLLQVLERVLSNSAKQAPLAQDSWVTLQPHGDPRIRIRSLNAREVQAKEFRMEAHRRGVLINMIPMKRKYDQDDVAGELQRLQEEENGRLRRQAANKFLARTTGGGNFRAHFEHLAKAEGALHSDAVAHSSQVQIGSNVAKYGSSIVYPSSPFTTVQLQDCVRALHQEANVHQISAECIHQVCSMLVKQQSGIQF